MFDIGFDEVLLVGLIALLVIGPERLPRFAKEAALWVNKARKLATSVKDEINHELELEDLKKTLVDQKKLLESSLPEKSGHQTP